MRYINHKSDFQVIINITDKDGNIISPPSVPWEAVFSDENCVEFKCYFDGTNYTHCIVDGNDIVCFVDNPGFSCGNLRCTFCQHVPSAEYCDGVMDLTQPLQCDIMLSERESDDSTPITIEASPNWVRGPQGIKGDKGDKGEKGDKGDTGAKGDKGDKGEQGIQGEKGVKGDRGEKGDQGERGLQGVQGIKGDDGVSPTVNTSKTGKVTTIEITDAQGTHTATVNDGESVEVVQSTGTSTTAVMSQKASTMAFAANTPSGDPMHNLYVSMGAVWNGSGVDKTYPTPWADYAEEEEDKVYVHKNGCWAYCYVGDLTSEDMADIAILPKISHAFPPFFGYNFRGRAYASNISQAAVGNFETYTHEYTSGFETFCQNFYNEVIVLHDSSLIIDYRFKDSVYTFAYSSLRCIFGSIGLEGNDNNVFSGDISLKFVFLYKLGINMSFKDCPKLSKHCVRYMIENAADATITITLHPEAYERAIADTGVQTALSNKTNVSLAKAE